MARCLNDWVVSQYFADLEVGPVSEGHKAGGVAADSGAGARPVLASDADRDAVAGQLSSALADGRLTTGEHAERVEAAYTARTVGALSALTADLPAPARDAVGREQAVIDSGVDWCLLSALLIFCPPAGVAALLAARKRARAASRPPGVLRLGGASAEDR
jgi:Domain of unknown function (DUF1707)